MRTDWRSYFVFTKRERVGIVVLVVLIVMVAVLPLFFTESKNDNDRLEWERYRKELAIAEGRNDRRSREDSANENHDEVQRNSSENKEEFLFDPNKLSENGWKRLGIRDRTIQTIHRFIEKGGRFREAEDLSRIYGMSKQDYNRLLPFVRIENVRQNTKDALDDRRYVTFRKQYPEKNIDRKISDGQRSYEQRAGKNIPVVTIDINSADSIMLVSLPGIGRVLASRIIRFRERLGGFYQVDQIKEVYGMSDSTFQLVRSALTCNAFDIRKINVNGCEQEQLARHPYIQWKLAGIIIEYRKQHGSIKIDELLKMVPEPQFLKLKPYLIE